MPASRISQENVLHKQITDELQQQKVIAIQERDAARVEQVDLIEAMKYVIMEYQISLLLKFIEKERKELIQIGNRKPFSDPESDKS